MMMSVDECFDKWRKVLIDTMGYERTKMAFEGMRPIIERAKQAESEGRIVYMQPMMANCNPTSSIKEGWFFLQIYYQPVIDGMVQKPLIKKFTILEPAERKAA